MLYLTNDSLDPAWNQAFEEYVFDHVTEDDVLLIWRNAPAVVCGRFQNVFAEVSVPEAGHRGIPVIRRPSGGGTVYLSVTKQGGQVLSMLSSRPAANTGVSDEAAVEAANAAEQSAT